MRCLRKSQANEIVTPAVLALSQRPCSPRLPPPTEGAFQDTVTRRLTKPEVSSMRSSYLVPAAFTLLGTLCGPDFCGLTRLFFLLPHSLLLLKILGGPPLLGLQPLACPGCCPGPLLRITSVLALKANNMPVVPAVTLLGTSTYIFSSLLDVSSIFNRGLKHNMAPK